jgi:MFS family permease
LVATTNSLREPESRLFAVPDYRRGWLLGLLSGIARWLEFLALGVFAYELTGSPPLVALLAIIRVAPYALLGFLFGAISDRIDRKRWLLVALGAMCVVSVSMALLAATGHASYPAIVAATMATGIFWLTDMPMRRRFMLDAVGVERSGRAMGFDNITNYVTRGLGPLLGGLAYQWFGAAGVFGLNFAAYLICLILAFGFSAQTVAEGPTASGPTPSGQASRDTRVRLLANSRFCAILGITVVYNLFCVPFIGMLPVFAKKDFGLAPAAVGSLAAFEGVGGLIGAIAIGLLIRPPFFFPVYFCGPLIYLASVLGVSFFLTPGFTVVALIVLSVGGACFSATQYVLIYTTAAPALRGRAFGFLSIGIGCATLGHWNAGLLFKHFESPTALQIMAVEGLVPLLALGVFSALMRPAPSGDIG